MHRTSSILIKAILLVFAAFAIMTAGNRNAMAAPADPALQKSAVKKKKLMRKRILRKRWRRTRGHKSRRLRSRNRFRKPGLRRRVKTRRPGVRRRARARRPGMKRRARRVGNVTLKRGVVVRKPLPKIKRIPGKLKPGAKRIIFKPKGTRGIVAPDM